MLLTQLGFLVQMVGVGYRAVYNDCRWLSARPNAHESVQKPADTNRLGLWLKKTSESCSLSWGLFAGCVNTPLKPRFH